MLQYRNTVDCCNNTDCGRYYSPLLLSLVTAVTGNGDNFLSLLGSSTTDDTCGR